MRVEFRLTMPGVSSWDGKWSGEGRNHVAVRYLPNALVDRLHLPDSWSYAFGDGWVARVDARILKKGERVDTSDGFCGYDWMIDSILARGHIEPRRR